MGAQSPKPGPGACEICGLRQGLMKTYNTEVIFLTYVSEFVVYDLRDDKRFSRN